MRETPYWEPWMPKVRDYVRVRLRPECPETGWLNGHDAEHNGRDAQVIATDGQIPGHPYTVQFLSAHWIVGSYAAIELQPIVAWPR